VQQNSVTFVNEKDVLPSPLYKKRVQEEADLANKQLVEQSKNQGVLAQMAA
jgi:hypothetical protein